jgi:hypothetical protein
MCRRGLAFGVFLVVWAGARIPASGQEIRELPDLKREYPGSGPYVCPAPATPVDPSPDDRARAGQLASDANQAMILGDLERVDVLLGQALELDPTSPDLAYRRARVLEDLNRTEGAMREYCRAIDLGVESLGVRDSRDRIDALYAQIRARLPVAAQQAFAQGLIEADDTLWTDAMESFGTAIEIAPSWADPIYNRAMIREYVGDLQGALVDFRAYLVVVADPEDSDAIAISQRIGALEGAASVGTPSPNGALALGVMPGMGHFYTRRPLPGAVTLTAATLSVAAGVMIKDITVLCVDEVPPGAACPPDLIVDEITERPYLWVGVGLGAVITIAGAVEAYLSAKKARAANEELFGPVTPDEPTEGGLEVGLPEVSSRGGQLDFSLVRYRFR